MITRRLAVTIGFLIACAGTAYCAAPAEVPWHLANWSFRKVLHVRSRAPAGWVDTDLGGRTEARGADLRVVDPKGKNADMTIMHSTPEGRFLVLFDTSAGPGNYYLYCGRAMPPIRPAWNPRAGLTLEIRTRAAGTCGNWAEMKKMIDASKEVQGVTFRSQIFDGYNPVGPSDNYISIYHGWLNCPRDGLYHFSTMSDDASFLFIDDTRVCEWPGLHTVHAGRKNRFQGQIRLRRGVHRIAYYHVEYTADQATAAAWQPPGANYFQIIPPSAFVQAAPAEELRGEQHFRSVTADFKYSQVGYLEATRAKLTSVRFIFSGAVTEGMGRRCTWDFGDGTSVTGENILHVYTAMGVYPVELTVLTGRRRASYKTKVCVTPVWRDLDFRNFKIKAFADVVKRYEFGKMTPQCLAGAMHLFKAASDDKTLLGVCQALYLKRDKLDLADRYDLLVWFGDLMRGQPDEAMRLYQLALPVAKDNKAQSLEVEMKLADVLLYYKHACKDAIEMYKLIRQKYASGDPVTIHVALIRIGDAWRALGNRQEALKAYAEAENDPRYRPRQPKNIMKGAYGVAVQENIRENKPDEALELIDKWEWEYPTGRLDGYNLVLRARANLVAGNYAEARKQGEIFTRFSTDPNYLPEALMVSAEACKSLADYKTARNYCRRVLKDFPESPMVDTAKGMLKQLEKLIVE